MKYKLEGIQMLDFTTKEGTKISGNNLYVTGEANGVVGLKTDKIFVNNSITLPTMKVGDIIDVGFTKTGKVEKITVIKA